MRSEETGIASVASSLPDGIGSGKRGGVFGFQGEIFGVERMSEPRREARQGVFSDDDVLALAQPIPTDLRVRRVQVRDNGPGTLIPRFPMQQEGWPASDWTWLQSSRRRLPTGFPALAPSG